MALAARGLGKSEIHSERIFTLTRTTQAHAHPTPPGFPTRDGTRWIRSPNVRDNTICSHNTILKMLFVPPG